MGNFEVFLINHTACMFLIGVSYKPYCVYVPRKSTLYADLLINRPKSTLERHIRDFKKRLYYMCFYV